MADTYEMNPAARLTVGTLGEPGKRTFYLQAITGLESYAVVIEKEQALALANAIDQLLEELADRYEIPPPRPDRIPSGDLELQLPIEGRFRVGQLILGYEERSAQVVLTAQEAVVEGESGASARFWVTRDQAAALGRHVRSIAQQGRPICALCGQPISAEGHFCPRSNGHSKH